MKYLLAQLGFYVTIIYKKMIIGEMKLRKMLTVLIAMSLAIVITAMPIHSASAAPAKFKNCTELNKTYPGGVAKNAKVKNVGGKTKYKPFVSAEIYKLHTKMDRDKDGIACER